MNKKQIDIEKRITIIELTNVLCGKPCDLCKFYGLKQKCMPEYTAEKLYNAGYREQTDTAREIFAEIKEVIKNNGSFDELDLIKLQMKYAKGGEQE